MVTITTTRPIDLDLEAGSAGRDVSQCETCILFVEIGIAYYRTPQSAIALAA